VDDKTRIQARGWWKRRVRERNGLHCHCTALTKRKDDCIVPTSFLFVCVSVVMGFELRAYTVSHSTSPFCDFFLNRVS
jgi:hypothetical protein